MNSLIETIKDRCHECYACVRNCPVKALRVKNGQTEVIDDRCIHCGDCVRVCSQGAKKVRDYQSDVIDMIKSGQQVVVGLAPSFPSFNPDFSLEYWLNYLYALGFARVYEVAWGAQIIIKEYKKILKTNHGLLISTPCPVVVKLINKYYPELTANLVPIASPMLALKRYIEQVEGPDTQLVLVGPCQAKKGEFADIENCTVLTFSEVIELGAGSNINLTERKIDTSYHLGREPIDSARRLPLTGGLIKSITNKCDFFPKGYILVEGQQKVFDLLNSITRGEIRPKFIDILFCEGCINGIDLSHANYFKKEYAVNGFINKRDYGTAGQVSYFPKIAAEIDCTVKFTSDSKILPEPTAGEIWTILNQTDKSREEDLLNCGACGYNSCREKAIAVYQGLAEVEMCLPYLLSEKRSELKQIQALNRELDTLINSSYDGMVMISNQGKVEKVNQAYLKLLEISQAELMEKTVFELEQERIIYPSVSKLCLKEKRQITLIQNTKDGQRLLTTASPLLDEHENILRVMVNARSLTKLNQLASNFREEEKLRQYLEINPDKDDKEGPGHIIYSSADMKNIIRLCQRIARTVSNVLIMGESGVGKEVIARYIHEQCPERESLVKINCAAIPESLLESELFGYETGAFSGAKREGKPGLIEKADGGTLLLDEIAEMPINMQAKLLQVLQEHRVTRIGGVDPIAVDFRLICATNKDLKKLVAEKEFREDLYYRLNVVPIYISPLRERPADILPLINYNLEQLNQRNGKKVRLKEDSLELLLEYDWPGNVRELANLLERVVVTADQKEIEREFLEKFIEFERSKGNGEIKINQLMPLQDAVDQVERKLLLLAKEKGGTTYQMADILGVNQSTIVRKMKKYFS